MLRILTYNIACVMRQIENYNNRTFGTSLYNIISSLFFLKEQESQAEYFISVDS